MLFLDGSDQIAVVLHCCCFSLQLFLHCSFFCILEDLSLDVRFLEFAGGGLDGLGEGLGVMF